MKVYLVMGSACDEVWVEDVCASRGVAEGIINDLRRVSHAVYYDYWVDEWIVTNPAPQHAIAFTRL